MLCRLRTHFLQQTCRLGAQLGGPVNKTAPQISAGKPVFGPQHFALYSTSDKPGDLEKIDENKRSSRSIKKYFNVEPISGISEAGDTHSTSWQDVASTNFEQFEGAASEGLHSTRVIYDIDEKALGLVEEPASKPAPVFDILEQFNLERGKHGVYDLEDLVDVLTKQRARDLVAIKIPDQLRFVHHMVIVTAKSQKLLNAIAQTVRRVYNKKMSKKDRPLILEGRDSTWVAMDLGNIALHIMSPAERKRMDIESLWLCGPEHDLHLQKSHEVEEDDIFSLAMSEPQPEKQFDVETFDVTKLYDHPFCPVAENAVLPDHDEITDANRTQYCATSLMEMALRKHNGVLSKKYRGRFRK